jgi:TetR/AcrR family transcriptional repressor of nem operon
MNARTERKQRSRETILQSASRLVRERGIARSGIAEIMEGAGLTVGGFYAHFASKQVLMDEIIRRTGAEMRARLFARLGEKPREARAAVVLKRYLSPAHRDQEERGCPLPAVTGEIATAEVGHRDVLAEQIDLVAAELRPLLPERAGARARHLALGLVALMIGGLTLSRALRGTAMSDDVLRACREVGQTLLHGRSPEHEEES